MRKYLWDILKVFGFALASFLFGWMSVYALPPAARVETGGTGSTSPSRFLYGNGSSISSVHPGTGLSISGGALNLDTSGNWSGTFGGQNSAYYLSRSNHTDTQGASTISAGTFGSGNFSFQNDLTLGGSLNATTTVHAGGNITGAGILNITGLSTSTIAGGLSITSGGLNFALPNCNGTNALTTNASGGVVCGAITGDGVGITSLNGLTAGTQTFSVTNGDPLVNLAVSSSVSTHTFTLQASSSPTFGYITATSTNATSTVWGLYANALRLNLPNCGKLYTGTSGDVLCGTDADTTYTAGTNLNLSGTTFNLNTDVMLSDGLYATSTVQTGAYFRQYGNATSTLAGGLYANDIKINLPNCNGNSVLETDAQGAITCGSDAGAGGGITSLNSLTDSSQNFSVVNNDPLVSLGISSVSPTHTFTLTASSSPAFGYVVATSTTAQSVFHNILFTNATSTTLNTTVLTVGADKFTDLTGSGLSNTGGALTLDRTGDWTGTFDGQEGTWYRDRANHTGTQNASTIAAGTFGSGNFTFPGEILVSGSLNASTTAHVTGKLTLGNLLSVLGTGTSTVSDGISAKSLSLTNGLTLTGGVIKSTGSGTSTFAGGIFVDAIKTNLGTCSGTSGLIVDTGGGVTCGTISGLSTLNFTSANVSQWTNDVGYLVSDDIANHAFTSLTTSGLIVSGTSTLGTATSTALGLTGKIYSTFNGTNTFAGGIYADSFRSNLVNCNTVDTDTSGAFICGADETGGSAGVPNLIYRSLSGTKYYTASSSVSDNLAFHFNNGFVSLALSGVGTTTPWGQLSVDQNPGQGVLKPIFVVGDNGTSTPFLSVNQKGGVGVGTSTTGNNALLMVGTSTPLIHVNKVNGKVGILGINNNSNRMSIGAGSNLNVNPNVFMLIQDPSDARFGASVSDSGVFMKSSGGVYAFNYGSGIAKALALQEFGSGVVIGQTSLFGSEKLGILGADNGIAQVVRVNASSANCTAADTFIDFQSTAGSIGSIACTASSGVIAYNTFTGSHYTQIDKKDDLFPNALLCATGEKVEFKGKETLFTEEYIEFENVRNSNGDIVGEKQNVKTRLKNIFRKPESPQHLSKSAICDTKGMKSVYGVYGGTDSAGRDMVLSIGTGYMWVANTGANLEVGDFLISSSRKGYAEKQEDDVYRNSTAAKVMENVSWEPGEIERLISVVYLGG